MSKTVDYFKKKYDRTFARTSPYSLKSMTAAIKVLTAYGVKNKSSHEQMANFMAKILNTMMNDVPAFEHRMISHDQPVFNYFIFSLQQTLGFIDLKTTITEDALLNPELVMTQAETEDLYNEFARQIESPTTKIQKTILGVMISLYVNKFPLTAGNSGFASACFVVAKELKLQNISKSVWQNLITAANFPGSFLGKTTSSSRRAAEISQLVDGLPAYSENLQQGETYGHPDYPSELEAPPVYEPPPDYEEDDVMGETTLPINQ